MNRQKVVIEIKGLSVTMEMDYDAADVDILAIGEVLFSGVLALGFDDTVTRRILPAGRT